MTSQDQQQDHGSPQLLVPPVQMPPALWPPLIMPPLLLPGATPEQHAALLAFAQQQQAALAALAAATAGQAAPALLQPKVEPASKPAAEGSQPEEQAEAAEGSGGPIQCKTRRTLPDSIAEQLGLGQGAAPGVVIAPTAAPLEAPAPTATAAAT